MCINTQTVCGAPYFVFSCVLSLICALTPLMCVICVVTFESVEVFIIRMYVCVMWPATSGSRII